MSIAASIVVRPSRLLLLLVYLLSIAVILIAALVGFAVLGDLPLGTRSILLAVSLMAAIAACARVLQQRKSFRLDISANGQILLMEYNGLAISAAQACGMAGSRTMRLLPDSTMWPGLLLLRMYSEDCRTIVLPIMRDSVSAESFRALSVACRWIAAQNNRAKGKNCLTHSSGFH